MIFEDIAFEVQRSRLKRIFPVAFTVACAAVNDYLQSDVVRHIPCPTFEQHVGYYRAIFTNVPVEPLNQVQEMAIVLLNRGNDHTLMRLDCFQHTDVNIRMIMEPLLQQFFTNFAIPVYSQCERAIIEAIQENVTL